MRLYRLVLALLVMLVPALPISAQLSALSISRAGDLNYASGKDTMYKVGAYAAGFNGQNFFQFRRGMDGDEVVGVFAGRNLIRDSYNKYLRSVLSVGALAGRDEKGIALESFLVKSSLNDMYVAVLQSEYGWGAFGTQNFARNSLLYLYTPGESIALGVNAEAIYRPRRKDSSLERAEAGPVVRLILEQGFVQFCPYWDFKRSGESKLTVTVGLNPF